MKNGYPMRQMGRSYPDYEELIPAVCHNHHNHIHAQFEGRHPDLGDKISFAN